MSRYTDSDTAHQRSDNSWHRRALLGITGQALVLTSSMVQPGKVIDMGVAGFAACNLLANAVALRYGAAKKYDEYETQLIIRDIDNLTERYSHATAEDSVMRQAFDIDATQDNILQKLDSFIATHASRVSIGLRYAGAINMLASGMEGHNNAKVAGAILALTGKTISLTQHTHSPYQDDPPSTSESLRQHSFTVGALCEATAYGIMATDAYQRFAVKPQEIHPLLFAGGQSCFVGAYISRLGAEYETLHTDTDIISDYIMTQIDACNQTERAALFNDINSMLEEKLSSETIDQIHERLCEYMAIKTTPDVKISNATACQSLLSKTSLENAL